MTSLIFFIRSINLSKVCVSFIKIPNVQRALCVSSTFALVLETLIPWLATVLRISARNPTRSFPSTRSSTSVLECSVQWDLTSFRESLRNFRIVSQCSL